PEPALPRAAVGDPRQGVSEPEVEHRRQHEQAEETPVEESVEHIRRDEQQAVLTASTELPIEHEDRGQEREVLQRVEGHQSALTRRTGRTVASAPRDGSTPGSTQP